MKMLVTNSEAAARALEHKATAWLKANVARYEAGDWSEAYVSPDGASFGIAFEDRIAPTFTVAELDAHTSAPDANGKTVTTFNNVQDVTLAQAATATSVAVVGWSVVPDIINTLNEP